MPDLGAVALTAGLIVAGATGAQLIKSPEAWPRTVGAFGQRIADQTAFYTVATGSYWVVARATGLRSYTDPCPRERLLRCAAVRTFTATDAAGAQHLHTPLLSSIVVASATSVLWRPERADNTKAWEFFFTRVGIVVTGYVAERVLVDWWKGRTRRE